MISIPLRQLDPRYIKGKDGEPTGISFECPACTKTQTHRVRVRWADAQRNDEPLWERSGLTFDELTLSPSIDGTPSCKFHGFLRMGKVCYS